MQSLSGTGTGSRILTPLESSDLSFLFFSSLCPVSFYPSSLPLSPLSSKCPALLHLCGERGLFFPSSTRQRSWSGMYDSRKPVLLLTSAGRPCSTRFTRVLSHASAFRRGKTFVCRKISPFPSVRLRFPSSVSHTLSVRQRRRHDKTQFREARMEHERPPLAEIRRKQAFPCCLSPD